MIDPRQLANALQHAKDAHTRHEKQHGVHEDWPLWYADFMIANYPELFEQHEHVRIRVRA